MKTSIIYLFSFLCLSILHGQKRLTPPKAKSNIESVDKFVAAAFEIYNTTYDFHYGVIDEGNLNDERPIDEDEDGMETEGELEEEGDIQESSPKDEFKILEENINVLVENVPNILEEIDNHSVAKQLKATLSVNRAIKALKYSGKMVKQTFTGQ